MAFADAEFAEAKFVIFGIPFDATASYNPGSRFGPDGIRAASWNLENFILDLKEDVPTDLVHDMGNGELWTSEDDVRNDIDYFMSRAVSGNKVPVMLGGEHSITPLALEAMHTGVSKLDIALIVIDAHLDYRESYLGNRFSHACAVRRSADTVEPGNISIIGARSACMEEYKDAVRDGVNIITVRDADRLQSAGILNQLDNTVGDRSVYISIDLDGIDPSQAPGVGTPEPYGLGAHIVRDIIEHFGKRAVALDVVEYLPSSDPAGITGMLAAELIRRFITVGGSDLHEDI